MLAAVVVASTTLLAAPGKKKKKEAEPKAQPVVLQSASDTLSYAAGQMLTRGLMDFIVKEYKVDTAYMADFISGYREAMSLAADPKFTARSAGTQIAQMVINRMLPNVSKQFEGSEHTIDALKAHEGFIAAVSGDTTVMTVAKATDLFQTTRKADEEKRNAAWKSQNEQWLKDNATKEGVKTLPSGLQYKVITEGKGEIPTEQSTVTVKYEGKLIDGTEFDSSYKRNPQTTDFRPSQVIKGWREALCMMPVGSKWELYIPQELAYGSRNSGGPIKPYSTLIFTVELVKSETKAAEPAAAPKADAVAAPAAKAAAKKAPAKEAAARKAVTKKK